MKVICIDARNSPLVSGEVYNALADYTCTCGRKVVHIDGYESLGAAQFRQPNVKLYCMLCKTRWPLHTVGWFKSIRFIPWNPDLSSDDEVEKLYKSDPRKKELVDG
jgi:hypothetical protein